MAKKKSMPEFQAQRMRVGKCSQGGRITETNTASPIAIINRGRESKFLNKLSFTNITIADII
ncbi:MAG: hypothetical protein V7K97_00620 [Nostoc sp.]|uniref:hypothetical protein n=1 Tax=Nostoc sp. TaxID=1180 RepID=UPI002FF77587